MKVGALRSGDPERLGPYALIGRVGEGGQGTVFLAEDGRGGRVAVKLLHAELTADDKARARFLRELEVAKRVAPFCTAQVIDADATGDRPYIVSEYVPGPSLNQLVTEQGPLSGAALERLAVGTATALAAIHQAEIIHRDFKPHNVLIGSDGPRVIDFGVARAISGSTTLTSKVIGTPSYMAPEQLQGDEIGTAADVFCWAATLAFAATGEPPFGQDTIPAVINRILHREPELGDLDGPLRALVVDCLSKEAAGRPDARQLLMRLLGHEERGAATAALPVAAAPAGAAGAAADGADGEVPDDATAILAAGSVLAAELGEDEARAAATATRASRAAAGREIQTGYDSAYDDYDDYDDGYQSAGYDDRDDPGATGRLEPVPAAGRDDRPGGSGGALTPSEWAAQNTLPPEMLGERRNTGGLRHTVTGPRRTAALAGAAALVVAVTIISTVLALSGGGNDKTGHPVSDSKQPVPPASSVPSASPTLSERIVPTPQDTATGPYSPSPSPTYSDTPTGTPTPTPTPTASETTKEPTPTPTPTETETDPQEPPGPGEPGTGGQGGTGTGG
ncbi:serine/threonine-protein kinase [Actinomadura rugatobispora]|uniref:Serine/threonine-protein kinase n=1 Tax=Actinomadura rugatobispora TaxID=1994 RepID=A0ABW0ZLS8_9ACTN|nr:hypothetical protein GCM10010200_058150 [Actinomadura rugatobispora]